MSTTVQNSNLEWYSGVSRSIVPQTIVGVLLILAGFGGFGTWAFTAPLAAAVIAQGSFVATGENKIVQHLEGGIIKDLLVREGDRVEAGQDLVLLDETAAMVDVQQLRLRQARLEAVLARLHAEAQGWRVYTPPRVEGREASDPDIVAIHESQRQTFEASLLRLESELGLVRQNISALEYRRAGRVSELAALDRQIASLREELEAKSSLLAKGLTTRPVVAGLERSIADGEGDVARVEAEISEIDAQVEKHRQEMLQMENALRQSALKEAQALEAELDGVREQILKARSILVRTSVVAPVAGTVVRSYYHTSGGVIESGKPIFEILPSDVPLIIEAQIPRMQIDEITHGQAASVRLTALNQRTTPMLIGEVVYVSADAIAAGSGSTVKEVYLARISISPEEMSRISGFQPTPGMPAEILIQTQTRTFYEYIAKPITDSMTRAFREY
jgi:HlyD family secretion protein